MDKQLFSSILKTLSYADIFDFPLTLEEIWKYLISEKPVSVENLVETIKANEDFIEKKGKYYFLLNRAKIVSVRKKRENYSRKKLITAKKVARILSYIPQIKLLGISGSLAVGNSDKADDIDIFIITKKDSLWTTRFLVSVILLVLGVKRRINEVFVQDKICPNMYLAQDSLEIAKNMHSLFSAHEIAQLKVLVNKDKSYEKFLSANSWILNFLPNIVDGKLAIKRQDVGKPYDVSWSGKDVVSAGYRNNSAKCKESGFFLGILKLIIEKSLYKLQILYMKRHKTNELISENMAKFHPQDKTRKILELYNLKYFSVKGLTKRKKNYHKTKKLFYGDYVYTLGY